MLPSALPQSISTMEPGSCVFVMGMAGEAWPMRLRQATTRRALKQESGHGLAEKASSIPRASRTSAALA